jgi:DNA-binding transcriptional regulator LsrR (DeoR family)
MRRLILPGKNFIARGPSMAKTDISIVKLPSNPDEHPVLDDALGFDPEEQLATRAAWLYFVAGNTQAEIGKKLGLSRIRINRLLALAREQGLVQISITGRLADCVSLEEQLKERFALSHAVVVPTPLNQSQTPFVIGNAAGQYLGSQLKDGLSIGVGWGRTLRYSLRSVPRGTYKKITVVSLMGGLTQASLVNPHETASHLADIIGAQCYYIAAPALTDSEATRDIFLQQSMVREVVERGAKVDLALVSVGDLTPSNTMSRVGLISADDAASLVKAGAVGDICVHWINAEGKVISHPMNKRVVALSPERLKDVPRVIVASGGRNKVPALFGALNAGFVNVVVTDETTARDILKLRSPPDRRP